MKLQVWNRRHGRAPKSAVYVGRPSAFGNPHYVGWCNTCRAEHTRTEAIQLFRDGLSPQLKARIVNELRGKHLVCWCAPLACHADVLLEIANARADA